jgi:hypothetical protein
MKHKKSATQVEAKQFFQQAVGIVGHAPDQVATDSHPSILSTSNTRDKMCSCVLSSDGTGLAITYLFRWFSFAIPDQLPFL